MTARTRRLLGVLLLVVAVYTLGAWQGGKRPTPAAPPPTASSWDACAYYQDLAAWREADKVVKRRGIETFCE